MCSSGGRGCAVVDRAEISTAGTIRTPTGRRLRGPQRRRRSCRGRTAPFHARVGGAGRLGGQGLVGSAWSGPAGQRGPSAPQPRNEPGLAAGGGRPASVSRVTRAADGRPADGRCPAGRSQRRARARGRRRSVRRCPSVSAARWDASTLGSRAGAPHRAAPRGRRPGAQLARRGAARSSASAARVGTQRWSTSEVREAGNSFMWSFHFPSAGSPAAPPRPLHGWSIGNGTQGSAGGQRP
jgi:hypothetical protein